METQWTHDMGGSGAPRSDSVSGLLWSRRHGPSGGLVTSVARTAPRGRQNIRVTAEASFCIFLARGRMFLVKRKFGTGRLGDIRMSGIVFPCLFAHLFCGALDSRLGGPTFCVDNYVPPPTPRAIRRWTGKHMEPIFMRMRTLKTTSVPCTTDVLSFADFSQMN